MSCVYKDDLISTIVDVFDSFCALLVYKDDLISTIVNISGLWAKSLSYHIRDKFGKTVIKDLMAETLVFGFFPAALDK